ncbi:MAG TPA: glycoside hydrolase family 57 protein [Syntrophales bacterium]|nr:glycoside hydrolase family 57 protein [Syntrophales bacterium]HOL58716.1 glycoside hydrolase family 57 protein [Syntrophales bacterium]HPO34996.1 glycoside hydrolase family 57 protein [Syntrophales bacterium]
MPAVCIYFQVHQPLRHRRFSVFDIGKGLPYEDEEMNRQILEKVADKCYLPANLLLRELIEKYEGKFRLSFSLSGIILEQLQRYRPEVLDSFVNLAQTGAVEFLGETYYHSLASLFSLPEFRAQVKLHQAAMEKHFKFTPRVFRNTELIYSDALAEEVEKMGYQAMLAEGADRILGWRSPNFVYQSARGSLRILLRNYRLSDDVAFRFSDRSWSEYPLMADKFARWIKEAAAGCQIINLFMDYETFGEHQWADTGIFEFLRALPEEILKLSDLNFLTPSEVIDVYEPVGSLNVPEPMSWADVERDLTAWIGNHLQNDAIKTLYGLEKVVQQAKDDGLLEAWRKLQTSDYFYYMCTKWFADGDVHKYFNPYPSPYEAYINYMNIIDDFTRRVGGGKEA